MATWDVFYSDRLEVRRGLTTAEVREALGRGELRDDDLIRLSGTTPWARIIDMPPLADEPEPEPMGDPDPGPISGSIVDDDEEDDDLEILEEIVDDGEDVDVGGGPAGRDVLSPGGAEDEDKDASSLEIVAWDDDLDNQGGDDFDPQEEDEAAAEFTLARGSAETVEELDLAAMVDVAFQLVLFFLVTATTVLYKSLEVPRPNPESNPPAAAAQGQSKALDDLKETYIVVEIDPAGALKVDSEPTPAEGPALTERLRALRERTGRKAMLLSADFSTPHRSAVLAYDAANEIGLGIAIARPKPK